MKNITNIDWNSIVPQPQSLELRQGSIPITKLSLFSKTNQANYAELHGKTFTAEAQLFCQRHPELQNNQAPNTDRIPIQFAKISGLSAEGYRITINPESVLIEASSSAGAFYATMTLSQWLWQYAALPVAQLADEPRFVWRGYMLDVSRHFFSVSYIKELMQQLASYKINRFHLHLTDDQGWRLPIAKYPKLTEFGSKRYSTFDHFHQQAPGEISEFYSAEEIAELNQLAAQLHMVIVPEIDLPGHATAALACYPKMICAPFQNDELKVLPILGISRNVLCLGKKETWDFVYAVLDGIIEVFPGEYIHLGGDEVIFDHWQQCPDCQKLIEIEDLKDTRDLQNLFTQRSRNYIRSKGKIPLYWDEVEENGFSEGTICCFWRSWPDSVDISSCSWDVLAASKGVPVISCPVTGAYFDYKHTSHPHESGNIGILSVYNSYHFLPLADKEPELAKYNLGVQANLWTEKIDSVKDIQYMSFPRVLAMAEQGWNKGGWELFQNKWPMQQQVLEAQGVYYYYRGPWRE